MRMWQSLAGRRATATSCKNKTGAGNRPLYLFCKATNRSRLPALPVAGGFGQWLRLVRIVLCTNGDLYALLLFLLQVLLVCKFKDLAFIQFEELAQQEQVLQSKPFNTVHEHGEADVLFA